MCLCLLMGRNFSLLSWLVIIGMIAAALGVYSILDRPSGSSPSDNVTIKNPDTSTKIEGSNDHLKLPSNPFSQIGVTRRWIPKEVDARSVAITLRMLSTKLGLRDPDPGGDTQDITKNGLNYEEWSGRVNVDAPCRVIQAFIEALESQQDWPTLIVDHFEKQGTLNFGIPVSGIVDFHITAREADSPEETEAEYLRLVNERGSIATPELCEPIPEEGGQTEARQAEVRDVSTAITALTVENDLIAIPNAVSTNTAPCTTGTQDMAAFPDTSSARDNGGKINDPAGDAYQFAAGDAKGYLLFGHDITADGKSSPTVNYVNFDTTVSCYTIDSNGTVHQYDTTGALVLSGAHRTELSNVQTAFDTLLGEGVVGSVAAHSGVLVEAVHAWTGLPVKSDGSAIQVGGVDADLTDYMRLSGAGDNETTYAYCWDANGKVWLRDRGTMCGDGD